jgi:hypothetical protein
MTAHPIADDIGIEQIHGCPCYSEENSFDGTGFGISTPGSGLKISRNPYSIYLGYLLLI